MKLPATYLCRILCTISLVFGLTHSLTGAVDMFIKIEGIEGESIDAAHRDEIDVLAWSWGMSNDGTTHTGGGGAGKVSFQDLTIT